MGNHLARHTTRRTRHQAACQNQCAEFMAKYDVSRTGTLSRQEVKTLATDLCVKSSVSLVGGITDNDVDMIMRCGGEDCTDQLSANDLPLALAVVLAVRDDSENFHQLFLRHDADNSGVLPEDQLTTLLTEINDGHPPGANDVSYILRQCEPRGRNDAIPESQLKCAIACWYCCSTPAHDKIKQMFKAWDTEGTGVISIAELEAVMGRLSAEAVKAEDVTNLFNSIDQNHDGSISYDEFVDWVIGGGVPLGAGLQEEPSQAGKPEKIKWSTGWLKNR